MTDLLVKALNEAVSKYSVDKGRRYIDDPDDAPDDVEVQEGPEGGYYFETDDGGDEEDGEEGGEDGDQGGDTTNLDEDEWDEVETEVHNAFVGFDTLSRDILEAVKDRSFDDLPDDPEQLEEFAYFAEDLAESREMFDDDPEAAEMWESIADEVWERQEEVDVDVSDPDEVRDYMEEEFGEEGAHYVDEAAHQYGSHFDEYYDDIEDVIDDFETFQEMS